MNVIQVAFPFISLAAATCIFTILCRRENQFANQKNKLPVLVLLEQS